MPSCQLPSAAIAQLGERQTEDLNVPGSGLGMQLPQVASLLQQDETSGPQSTRFWVFDV